MYPEKPLITKVIMSALTFILILACELGNGLMFAVIARFKSLRTIQNILIANLCLVDFLSAVIAFTMYMIYTVLEAGWFRGKALGILTCGFDRLFATLNLLSMLVILVNKYLEISYGFKYLAWKTKTNAVIRISLVWFVGIISTVSSLILLSDINLGDAHVIHYRTEIFKQGKLFVAATRAFFVSFAVILSCLTARAIQVEKKKRGVMNLCATQAKARLKQDLKAIKTIFITIAAYLFCHIPVVVFATIGLQEVNQAQMWFAFIAWYCAYFSSAVNPIIYYTRLPRVRCAVKQFLKDPFGTSEYNEEQYTYHNAENGAFKNNIGREVSSSIQVHGNGNSTSLNHAGKRKREIKISSAKARALVRPEQNLSHESEEKAERFDINMPEKITWDKTYMNIQTSPSKHYTMGLTKIKLTKHLSEDIRSKISHSGSGGKNKRRSKTRESKIYPQEVSAMSKTDHSALGKENGDLNRSSFSGGKAKGEVPPRKGGNRIEITPENQQVRKVAWTNKAE